MKKNNIKELLISNDKTGVKWHLRCEYKTGDTIVRDSAHPNTIQNEKKKEIKGG